MWQKYQEIILGIGLLIWTFVSILLLIEQSSSFGEPLLQYSRPMSRKISDFQCVFSCIYILNWARSSRNRRIHYFTFFTGDDFVFIKYMAEWSRLAWERLSERAIIDVLNGERHCVTANGCNDCNIAAWIQKFYSLSLRKISADRLRYWSSVLLRNDYHVPECDQTVDYWQL